MVTFDDLIAPLAVTPPADPSANWKLQPAKGKRCSEANVCPGCFPGKRPRDRSLGMIADPQCREERQRQHELRQYSHQYPPTHRPELPLSAPLSVSLSSTSRSAICGPFVSTPLYQKGRVSITPRAPAGRRYETGLRKIYCANHPDAPQDLPFHREGNFTRTPPHHRLGRACIGRPVGSVGEGMTSTANSRRSTSLPRAPLPAQER